MLFPFSKVDPNFAYAYTLLGHEYVLTEELDKAMSCFRNAIRVDPRHYNAWWVSLTLTSTVLGSKNEIALAKYIVVRFFGLTCNERRVFSVINALVLC